jgi:hypothetical protein
MLLCQLERFVIMAQVYEPLETPIGILRGRDAIHLDAIEQTATTLTLRGEFNGALSTGNQPKWFPYTVRFHSTLAVKRTDIDDWFAALSNDEAVSSFDEIKNLEGISGFGVAEGYRHYQVCTYDEIFNIICTHYTLDL